MGMSPLDRAVLGLAAAAALVAATASMSGCSLTPPPTVSTSCLPEPLRANPRQVAAGSSVDVSSGPFECGSRYPAGKKYQLALGLVGRQPPVDLGTYPVHMDGSFAATVSIPRNTSPGEAAITVHGSLFDQCIDSGQQSCAGYGVSITIIPSIQ